MAYPGGLAGLKEQRRQQEIAALDKHPFLSGWHHIPEDEAIPVLEAAEVILELPEEYETLLWLYFTEHKSIEAASKALGIHQVRGVIEYCRRLISKRLNYSRFLDDSSMERILWAL